jgi:hypothetical protein
MVEIEIGVPRSQCLDRCIDSKERLVSENRRLGAAAQCMTRPHKTDVHH